MDFIVINLGDYSNSDVLDWADAKLKEHSDRRTIVTSHYLLDLDGTFGLPGQAVYEALKGNSNLFLILCGHRHGEARRLDVHNGSTVYTLLANYQERTNGGDGWLRILQFLPEKDQIRIETYSPTLNLYETDSDSQFELSYVMSTSQEDPDTSGAPGDKGSGSGGGGCFIATASDGSIDLCQTITFKKYALPRISCAKLNSSKEGDKLWHISTRH
jgi:hypothetical protein